jgi:hypothetical protein
MEPAGTTALLGDLPTQDGLSWLEHFQIDRTILRYVGAVMYPDLSTLLNTGEGKLQSIQVHRAIYNGT